MGVHPPLASNPSAYNLKCEKLKEGTYSLENFDHMLDMDNIFWTWFSISGRYCPHSGTMTTNADYDSAAFN